MNETESRYGEKSHLSRHDKNKLEKIAEQWAYDCWWNGFNGSDDDCIFVSGNYEDFKNMLNALQQEGGQKDMRKVAESNDKFADIERRREEARAIWEDLKSDMRVQKSFEDATGMSAVKWYDPDLQTRREATDNLRGRDECEYTVAGYSRKYEAWGAYVVSTCMQQGCKTEPEFLDCIDDWAFYCSSELENY